MLYFDNLYEIIFQRHRLMTCDEFVVISGYVGPAPVRRVREIPLKTTVVYGMYASDGIHESLKSALVKEEDEIRNLRVMCSTMPVHSKIYLWLNEGKVVHSLIGSANFSLNGLTAPYRETLAETTSDSFKPLESYMKTVLGRSVPCRDVSAGGRSSEERKRKTAVSSEEDSGTCELPLYLIRNGIRMIPKASGINWGMSKLTGTHVNIEDAYVPIPAKTADEHPRMFPVKQSAPSNASAVARANHRHNDAIEVIWDDGTQMQALLEGSRRRVSKDGSETWYPKQISSSPKKAVLGNYLRRRIGVPKGTAVAYEDLERYGRDSVSVSLQGEGIYYFDFSAKTKTTP